MLEVDVKTDNYPQETSWQLVDTCTGTTVQSKAAGSYPSQGTQYSDNWCLAEAQYQFTINDTWGDGICCGYGEGAYSVVWDGATQVSGGSFGSSQTTTFGSCSQAPPTPPPTPSPTTPNVSYSSLKCHIWISSTSLIETFALIICSNITCTADPSSHESPNTSTDSRANKWGKKLSLW